MEQSGDDRLGFLGIKCDFPFPATIVLLLTNQYEELTKNDDTLGFEQLYHKLPPMNFDKDLKLKVESIMLELGEYIESYILKKFSEGAN